MRQTHCLPLALFVLLTVAPTAPAQGIRWMNNLQDAQRLAQRDGRLILIHFYTDWCGRCRKLEHDVFPRTDVAAAMMRNYVPVAIDADRNRDIAAHYQVDRFPTDVIADTSGRVVFRSGTPQDPMQYIRLLDGVARDHRYATPGYAVASREGAQGRGRFTPANQPQNDRRQNTPYQAGIAGALAGQQSSGYDRSVPPARSSSEAGIQYPTGSSPNQFARQLEYGPRYAGQAPSATQPPAPSYTRPPFEPRPRMPRETYNPHVPPPTDLTQHDAPASSQDYRRDSRRVPANDYRTSSQPPPPSRQSAWQSQASQFDQRGLPPKGEQAGYRSAAQQAPKADARQQQFASSQVAPQRQEPPLALDGFCPVTLAEQEIWQQGDPLWGAVHRGRTYLFTSQRNQQIFLADPDRYSPMLSGYDPVRYIDRGELVPGVRQHGMWFGGKMYLFSDESSLERFSKSPEYYSRRAHAAMMQAGR